MAKGTYIGVNNVARKVKKMYVGVGGKARKVKKGYIGVNGVARLFYSAIGTLTKVTSSISDLSEVKSNLFGVTLGNHALIGGGRTSSNSMGLKTVDAYDASLTKSALENLSTKRRYGAAARAGDYGVFIGGNGSNTIDAYNTSLTKVSTNTTISQYIDASNGTSINGYAVFGGMSTTGSNDGTATNVVNAISSSLTRSILSTLSSERMHILTTSNKNYAFFAGGAGKGNYYATVDVYNKSLTKSTATDLSSKYNENAGAGSIGDYAVFAGTYYYSYTPIADAYDSSLTKVQMAEKPVNSWVYIRGASTENYLVFGSGRGENNNTYTTTNAYTESLTKVVSDPLTTARTSYAAVSVGNKILFAGGNDFPNLASVEAFAEI